MNNPIDTDSSITITEKASEQIRQIMKENNIPKNYALRISVKGGGCSGFTYNMGFDGNEKDGDTLFEHNDIKVIVDGKSLFYLMGTQLDYTDGLKGKGFIFNNPNAADTCG